MIKEQIKQIEEEIEVKESWAKQLQERVEILKKKLNDLKNDEK